MIDNFINLYPVTKTLRFKLIPVGKTEENFVNKRFLEEDEQRSADYKKMKVFIDNYHKKFIEEVLASSCILDSKLNEYASLYTSKRTDESREKMESIEADLRAQIANSFTKHKNFSKLEKKEMITELLHNDLTSEEDLAIVESFSKFTTYFTGFFQNRKNMYSKEEQSTAISYRCINDNLPKFLDNVVSYKKIAEVLDKAVFVEIKNSLMNNVVFDVKDIFSIDFFNFVLSESGIEFYNNIIAGYSTEDGKKIKGLNEYINLYNQQLNKEDRNLRLPKLKMLFKIN